MIKEKCTDKIKEISINVVQTEIESIRKKDITKTGLRIYKDGYIGISGGLGKIDEKDMERKARENLNLHIPYPCEASRDHIEEVDNAANSLSDEEFADEMEEVLILLKKEYDDFIFSNQMRMVEVENRLLNDVGLNLTYKDKMVEITLLIKEKTSANIFDTVFVYRDRIFDKERLILSLDDMIRGYKNRVDIPKEDNMPVIFSVTDELILSKFAEELNGYKFGTGASLFRKLAGQEKFSKDLTIYQSAEVEDMNLIPFFDAEGVVNKDYRYALIEKGKIICPYTDKKTSKEFNLPLTGSAYAEYDKVPSLSRPYIKIEPENKTLKEIMNGRMGIIAVVASGGDFTSDGTFGTPIQVPFLTDGDKILGRLPELNVSGHIYKMFGEDYLGTFKDKALFGERGTVVNLNVKKI
ncbi:MULTISPECIES: metallopeptidase TldD-related protein [Tissierellales]|jgi:PmbA protein|uniref:Peptidase U62 n=1 Tax=Acidilutibacter cellobiosedens TaxID=2507161 RepID=A0A410Q9W4_9FIRM|nr:MULTISPECIES: metallopeptidase TldD-related protein [Tissierellales]QAT60781.1 peptidase U62 [Acidilutibacter cellobiosedens]SCL87616.1 hypothetical protein PP176A_1344 [Sporanaerobacter sp. PP17-6a]